VLLSPNGVATKFALPQSLREIPKENSRGVDLKGPGIKLKSENRKDGHWGFSFVILYFRASAVPSRATAHPAIKLQVLVFPVNLQAPPLMSFKRSIKSWRTRSFTELCFRQGTTLTGATVVASTPLFEPWPGPGRVFYKIRKDVVAPRHFRESEDMGTIAVRYVVNSADQNRTRIRIDAIFCRDRRRRLHPRTAQWNLANSK